MLEQIAGAQAALESNIEMLRDAANASGDSAALATAQNQLSRLNGLQQRVEHMSGSSLVALRAEVMASVAASQALTQQARTAQTAAQAAEMALHTATQNAHREVDSFVHDFYERKIFDPYLRFASPEDEAAYRAREEARLQAIKDAQAEGTPEATLRAARLAQDQLRDAGAHGATASPDYASTMARLDAAAAPLETAIARSRTERETAQPTQLAADPLDAIQAASTMPPELLAALRGSGVTMPDQQVSGHGVRGAQSPASGIYLS